MYVIICSPLQNQLNITSKNTMIPLWTMAVTGPTAFTNYLQIRVGNWTLTSETHIPWTDKPQHFFVQSLAGQQHRVKLNVQLLVLIWRMKFASKQM